MDKEPHDTPADLAGRPLEHSLLKGGDGLKQGGQHMVAYRPDDWTRIKISVEPAPPPAEAHVYRFSHTIIRPTADVLVRAKRGKATRPRDEWTFEFEGGGAAVELEAACFYSTFRTFADDEDRWIAIHYYARLSPVLRRCARGDAAEAPLPRSLAGLTDDKAAAILSRALKADRDRIQRVIEEARTTREAFATLGREHFHHEALKPLFDTLGLR